MYRYPLLKVGYLLAWGMIGILCVACTTAEESQPTSAASPTTAGLVMMPTFPPSFTLATPSPVPLPITVNDPRFPIAPDSSGQALYERHCAECHGVRGEGQNPSDPYALDQNGLAVAPPHDNSGHTWHHPDQQNFLAVWAGRQTKGFNPMPGFSQQLTVDQIIQILAYIKTWWGEAELQTQLDLTLAAMESAP